MAQNETLQVTDEFIAQNVEYSQLKKSHKKGGPYSKHDRDKRRDEVHRLHIEYGYSARKIADLMKISRHTINGDIDFWYSKISKNVNMLNLESDILTMLKRMQVQMTRLREQLDKTSNYSERMSIERLIYDINSKILHTYQKLSYSTSTAHRTVTMILNDYKTEKNSSHRVVSKDEIMEVSKKAYERIERILEDDKLNRNISKKL